MLKNRIQLKFTSRKILNEMTTQFHYMHRPIHARSSPFGYLVKFDDKLFINNEPYGFIIFASIHFVKQKGLFGYDGLPTKWQVLSLARLWLNDSLPRNTASIVISKCLKPHGHENISRVGYDWLKVHPPRFLNEPYHIRLIISYADNTHGHNGAVYRAANFQQNGKTLSKLRHRNTRGSGLDNHVLTQYIYKLSEPNISINDIQSQMNLIL